MSEILDGYPLLLRGAWVTIQLTLYGSVLALVLAFVFGLAGASRSVLVRAVARVYVEFFRGIATLVLMYWFFYALPLVGLRFAPMFAAVLALGLNVGAYGAEVVRGAVSAVPKEQYEATIALNMRPSHRLRRVLLPQAFALMLPPFGNLLTELMKGSAVVSLISIADLMLRAQQLRQSTGRTTAVFLVILVMYFVIAQVLQLLVRYLERRSDVRLGRRPGKAPPESLDTMGAAK